ncbi:MAG: ABC transporter ATP-binding protein [Rhizobiales bacterium]|nr:ABC transporter ATP-binding protein [Hyphomicrobiales bacterium]
MSAALAQEPGGHLPAISIAGVSMVFDSPRGPVTALKGIDLAIPKNRFVSIVGRSGCGKSTLLRLICGLVRPTVGEVTVDGMSPDLYQRDRRFGFVFQEATLLPWRTALENVALPMKIQKVVQPARREERARDLLKLVRLQGFEGHYPSQLSGGMRQRVSIARALSYDPEILLMDEPFGALDEFTRQEMNEELVRLWQEQNRTIVFVTHNLAEALYLSDIVVVMAPHPGRVRAVIEVDLPRPRRAAIRQGGDFIARLARLEEVISHD